ncbi:hypothetical protein GCM10009610_38330 [Pseudonocardia xinjiangensis]
MGRFEVRQVNPGGILIHKPRLSIALRGYYLHGATSTAPVDGGIRQFWTTVEAVASGHRSSGGGALPTPGSGAQGTAHEDAGR